MRPGRSSFSSVVARSSSAHWEVSSSEPSAVEVDHVLLAHTSAQPYPATVQYIAICVWHALTDSANSHPPPAGHNSVLANHGRIFETSRIQEFSPYSITIYMFVHGLLNNRSGADGFSRKLIESRLVPTKLSGSHRSARLQSQGPRWRSRGPVSEHGVINPGPHLAAGQ